MKKNILILDNVAYLNSTRIAEIDMAHIFTENLGYLNIADKIGYSKIENVKKFQIEPYKNKLQLVIYL